MERACGLWVAAVVRRAGFTLALVGVLTVVVAAYAALNLGIDTDTRKLINPKLEFQERQRSQARAFHAAADGILVVIDADSPTAAGRAADDLAARLAPRTDLFSVIDVPGGGPFFARNALLYLSDDQLEDLTDRLSKVQPFLAEIARDQSLVGIADLLRKALAAAREGDATGFDLAAALDRVTSVVEAAADGKRATDPWGSALFGGAVGAEARQRIVALRPVSDDGMLALGAPELEAIDNARRALGLTRDRGFRVRITGEPVMNYEELGAVAKQSRVVAVVSFFLFSATIIFALRSMRVVAAVCGSLGVSLIWSNGVAAATVGDLNMISAAFNVLIVGLGGEFGIHYAMRYMELAGKGRGRERAIVETAESIGESLLSSAGTTSIGFFMFLLTDFRGVAQLGLIAGTGMFISFASTLTVLPALLAIGKEVPVKIPIAPAWLARLDRVPIVHARRVRFAAAAVAIAAVALLPFIRFDYNLTRLHDTTLESVETFQELLASATTSPWTADVVAPDLDAATVLAERLEAVPTVEEARTVLDFVPADQEGKLELIETAALFVPMSIAEGPRRTDAERREALARLATEARTDSAAGEGDVAAATRHLDAAITRFLAGPGREGGPSVVLARLERDLVGSLPQQIRDLQSLMQPSPVTLADLPPDLTRRMIAPDGRARVQATPKEDIGDSRALERFVSDVREIAPEASGLAVYVVEWGEVTWHAMIAALLGGFVCMLVFLIVLWRSVWDSLLAFFPLALAAVLTCAALVIFDVAFNFANVIVLPLLIGMSVDSGVHLVHRHRTNPEEADVLGTSTARAVFYSALTTMLSFASLAFTPHGGIAAIGQMLTIGVALVLVCYVIVLPAWLVWDDERRAARAR